MAVAGVTGEDEQGGGEQRRRVRDGAEHLDVAALDADVPHVKGEADRAETQAHDGGPLPKVGPPDGRLDGEMDDCRERGGGEAEARDGVAGHIGETAGQHRIDAPGYGGEQGGSVAGEKSWIEAKSLAAGDDEDSAAEGQGAAGEV